MLESLLKAFVEIVKFSPDWVKALVVVVSLFLLIVIVLKTTKIANKLLPRTIPLGFMNVQLLPVDDDKFNTGYHKLQYVMVLSLLDRSGAIGPIYTRCVNRLEPALRNVPVYDEAVYYTLERFPKKQPLNGRSNNSTGVIDARRIIPWQEKYSHPDPGSTPDPHNMNFDLISETDTFLSIGHYLNGLQGDKQDFRTRVYQDTNDARLVVDLSAIPGIKDIVVEITGQITRGKQAAVQEIDPRQISPGIYMMTCNDAAEGDTLIMNFSFDRTLAPKPGRSS